MSDTTELSIPSDMTVTTKTSAVNGVPEEWVVVKFGSPPRIIEVAELDLGVCHFYGLIEP